MVMTFLNGLWAEDSILLTGLGNRGVYGAKQNENVVLHGFCLGGMCTDAAGFLVLSSMSCSISARLVYR